MFKISRYVKTASEKKKKKLKNPYKIESFSWKGDISFIMLYYYYYF